MMVDKNTMSSDNKGNIEEGMSSICLDEKATPPGMKREDYLTWDEYFMSSAFLSAMRSKDPHTQVGAVIVNTQVSKYWFCTGSASGTKTIKFFFVEPNRGCRLQRDAHRMQ